jgi:hypothetical protein
MALFEGDTTAWEDIQIKMGNFAPRDPKPPSREERYKETMDRAERITRQDFVDTLLEANAVSQEDPDLVALRQARIEQLKKQDMQSSVRRITKESYLDEVTEGSKSSVIVVMMDRGGGSSFLESECRKLAKEWITEIAPSKGLDSVSQVRFYVGDVDELIGNSFPADSLPFAVVYAQGTCQTQMPKATIVGVKNSLVRIVKSVVPKVQEPSSEVEDNAADRDIRRELAVRRSGRRSSSSSEESDVSDAEDQGQRSKGYSSTYFERNVLRYR